MAETRKILVARSSSGDATLVSLSGVIDRSFELDQLVEGLRREVVFDMQNITRITSFGIRQWVSAMSELDVDYCGFINCPPVVTAQFNMVREFGGRGQLISFYAPFLCESCGHESNVLIDLRTDHEWIEGEPENMPCRQCDGEMEFDEVAHSYFDHARNAPPPRLPQAAAKLLLGKPVPKKKGFHIAKEVSGGLTALWVSGLLDDARAFKRLANGLQGEVVVVLSDVEAATDLAVQAFVAFLRSLEHAPTLARVPIALANRIEEFGGPDLNEHARFDSITARGGCGDQSHESLYLFPLLRPSAPAENVNSWPKCKDCSKRVSLTEGGDFVRKAHLVPTEALLASAYLNKYSQAPDKRDAPDEAFMPGSSRLVLGKYRVVKEIGQGGMGQVFLAQRKGPAGFEKNVVLKRIRQDRVGGNRDYIDLFLKEARLAARLSHPHVVQIYDLGLFSSEYVIAMEYVDGVDLATLIRAGEVLQELWPVEICCRLIANLCSGLAAAHEHKNAEGLSKPIIHRDVSPHNLLVSFQGSVKLTDFGVCMIQDETNAPTSRFTGKLAYAAPEQVLGTPSVANERSDIFSAAAVLYECLTMRRLIPRGTKQEMLTAIEEGPSPVLTYARSDIPPKLEEAFQRAISRDPAQRFASALEFEQALESVILDIGKPVAARQIADWAREQHTLSLAAPSSLAEGETKLEAGVGKAPSGGTEVAYTQTNIDVRDDLDLTSPTKSIAKPTGG